MPIAQTIIMPSSSKIVIRISITVLIIGKLFVSVCALLHCCWCLIVVCGCLNFPAIPCINMFCLRMNTKHGRCNMLFSETSLTGCGALIYSIGVEAHAPWQTHHCISGVPTSLAKFWLPTTSVPLMTWSRKPAEFVPKYPLGLFARRRTKWRMCSKILIAPEFVSRIFARDALLLCRNVRLRVLNVSPRAKTFGQDKPIARPALLPTGAECPHRMHITFKILNVCSEFSMWKSI